MSAPLSASRRIHGREKHPTMAASDLATAEGYVATNAYRQLFPMTRASPFMHTALACIPGPRWG